MDGRPVDRLWVGGRFAHRLASRMLIVFLKCRTALHWACKRGHVITVRYLLRSGADISIETHKGELPVNVTQSDEIRQILNKGLRHFPIIFMCVHVYHCV